MNRRQRAAPLVGPLLLQRWLRVWPSASGSLRVRRRRLRPRMGQHAAWVRAGHARSSSIENGARFAPFLPRFALRQYASDLLSEEVDAPQTRSNSHIPLIGLRPGRLERVVT